jgi:hypothetical protein
VDEPGRLLAAVAGEGGIPVLVSRVGRGDPGKKPERSPMGERLLSRIWRCPESNCTTFGTGADADSMFADMRTFTNPVAQPPPSVRAGAPTCPRHGEKLKDIGPRPAVEVLSVRIDGVIRKRFVVSTGEPVVVGRAPEGGNGVMLGQWLSEDARKWISRGHVQFALRDDGTLTVQDVSTNGSGIRPAGSGDDDDRIALGRSESRPLAPTDVVELYAGVNVGRSNMWATGGLAQPASVMGEAPTMALRKFDR